MPDEQSLLRCAVKKTAAVVTKHVKYALYGIAVFVGACITLWVLNVIYPAIVVAGAFIASLVSAIISVFAMIPWYVYGIAGVVGAYFGYGLAWCIARELTEEDWTSKTAIKFVDMVPIVLLTAGIASGVGGWSSILLGIPLWMSATFVCMAVVLFSLFRGCTGFAWESTDGSKPAAPNAVYYFFRFPAAAYHHYYVKKQP